jgi:predicted transposase YbfD/YdcC
MKKPDKQQIELPKFPMMEYLEMAIDSRQQGKIKHKMSEIIAMVFLATLANADDWVEIELFAKYHEKVLRQYLELPNGIPSHDTIQRVMAIVSPEFLSGFQQCWNELVSRDEGDKLRKLLSIDGKTQRGNGTTARKGNHIVSAVDENGVCLGQERVGDKTNEITAIPKLLDNLKIKGHIITTDAMGTQTEIAKKIRQKRADYVLALKANQGTLYDDVKLYFEDSEFLSESEYTSTVEKARSSIERREYWQTDDIAWLPQKKGWAGLQSIAMTRNTVTKNGRVTTEIRYFISSLPLGVDEIARAIRGHWMVESYHWHLDVTVREDANQTLDRDAAFNLNIVRKISLNILRLLDLNHMFKKISFRKKRLVIGYDPMVFFGMLFDI